MKIYKLSERELKKRKKENIICGVGYLILLILQIYNYGLGETVLVASALLLGFATLSTFLSSYKIDQCYMELDGKILSMYFRGKLKKRSDLEYSEIYIKEHKKNSKINILEKGGKLVIHSERYIGSEAFNEMIKDINDINDINDIKTIDSSEAK